MVVVKNTTTRKTAGTFLDHRFHPNCRSTTVPILAPEYREIAEEGRTRPAVVDGKAIQVPADTNWIDLAKAVPITS